jgi:hypothetical protein
MGNNESTVLYTVLIFAISVLVLSSCASQNTQMELHNEEPKQSYADYVLNQPMPPTDEALKKECTWIRSEVARQEGEMGILASMSLRLAAAYRQVEVRQNIAALESRAANIQCSAAFSDNPITNSEPNFEQCFSRCQQYTNRTKEECFDVCK